MACTEYKIKLQFPDMPLVDVGGAKSNYLPPEVCEILPNQPYRGKLTDEHTANMLVVAARPPNVNGATIVGRGLDDLGYRNSEGAIRGFGIGIGGEMTVVPGRILPSPQIEYGRGKPDVDERASWNLRNVRFHRGAKLEKWAVLLITDNNPQSDFEGPNDPVLRQTIKGFADMCGTSGMEVRGGPPPIVHANIPGKDFADPVRDRAIAAIQATVKTLPAKPALLLVILSNGDKHVYSGIKHLMDCYMDIATVCVHAAKIRKEKGGVFPTSLVLVLLKRSLGQLQYFANVSCFNLLFL